SFGDSNTRSESYAIEINRRLALYLERSGGSPLTLDISFIRKNSICRLVHIKSPFAD
ncbi:hypothetical protein M378DRAFT_13195, partial [Amanita muscaria Koide BX008]